MVRLIKNYDKNIHRQKALNPMIMRPLVILLALVALSACDTTASLKELRHATPSADPYYAALSEHYREYAEQQVVNYDWWSSKTFADKGLIVAYGHEVLPEKPEDWGLSKQEIKELNPARAALLRALTDNAKKIQPKQAASAVFHFDCWIENLDDGWQIDKIEACRDKFFTALHALEDTGSDKAAAPPPPTPTITSSSVLYFPFDRDVLEGEFLTQMEGLVASLKNSPDAQLVINGHADRAGDDNYNLELSARRAEYIRALLIKAGLDPKRVHYFAFGESDPAIVTDDDVRERANRRVEIFIE